MKSDSKHLLTSLVHEFKNTLSPPLILSLHNLPTCLCPKLLRPVQSRLKLLPLARKALPLRRR